MQLGVDNLLAIQVGFLVVVIQPRDGPGTRVLTIFWCAFCLAYPQGEALIPGERAESIERFTPADGSGVVFIKLADGRGWVPVRKRNGSFGVTPTDH